MRKNKFFDGFKWALLSAFDDCISNCLFEKGDLLYNTRGGYKDWDEAKLKITNSIQIKSPERGRINNLSNGAVLKFNENWVSEVEFTYSTWENGKIIKQEDIKTTQGKLLLFFRDGDFSIFKDKNYKPKPFLMAKELMKRKAVENFIENKEYEKNKTNSFNYFIFPFDPTDPVIKEKNKIVINSLSGLANYEIIDIALDEIKGINKKEYIPTACLRVFHIESTSPEKVRDSIKESLWPKRNQISKKKLKEVIEKKKNSASNSFKLQNHGFFISYKNPKIEAIYVHSFAHTPIVRYRLNTNNLNQIQTGLRNFLFYVIKDCPNHLFKDNIIRASKLEINMNVELKHNLSDTLILLAQQSRDFKKFKSRHENLQQYFLENERLSPVPLGFDFS